MMFVFSERPPAPSRVQLVRATTTTLEVCWGAIPTGKQSLPLIQVLIVCFITKSVMTIYRHEYFQQLIFECK